jgi:endonuclease III
VGTVKLSPRVRAESSARDAIPSIPPSAIEPFLSRPLVIEPDGLDNAPTIIATEDNRVIIEAGNQAYVRAMAEAELPEIERAIYSCGFFRMKARSLSEMSRDLVEKFDGQPPRTLDELVSLRGVWRKTANVVLGNAYGIEAGIVVDTHVGRLSRRMGLTKQADPVKIESDLVELVPRQEWTLFSHLLIDHGRQVCDAKKARCSTCFLNDICPRIGVTVSA